jgi:hypothetical protein
MLSEVLDVLFETKVGPFLAVLLIAFAPLAVAEEASEHVFPLWKELVKDRPQVPPPYGVGVVTNWLDSDWQITSGKIGIDDPRVPVEFASNSTANIRSNTLGAKADLWILPFLNAFIVVGDATAHNQLILRGAPLKFIPPSVGQPADLVRGDVETEFTLDGPFYTFGGVLSGGYKQFFASVDFSATETDFGHADQITVDQKVTYSIAPRVGYAYGLSQIWIGGRYLDVNTRIRGQTPIPSGQHFSFDVSIKTVAWNLTGGMRTVLHKNWEIMFEGGVGQRVMVTGAVGYRW